MIIQDHMTVIFLIFYWFLFKWMLPAQYIILLDEIFNFHKNIWNYFILCLVGVYKYSKSNIKIKTLF